jgi:hypothetical protein
MSKLAVASSSDADIDDGEMTETNQSSSVLYVEGEPPVSDDDDDDDEEEEAGSEEEEDEVSTSIVFLRSCELAIISCERIRGLIDLAWGVLTQSLPPLQL